MSTPPPTRADLMFDRLVQELASQLPAPVRARLAQDGYVIQTEPEAPSSPGTRCGSHYPTMRRIVLFRRPFERGDCVFAADWVEETLWHEVGHALGLDHAALKGYGL